jgi:hypothetical protein
MPVEADVPGFETDAFGDRGSCRRRGLEPLGQLRQLEMGGELGASAMLNDANDVADPFLEHDRQVLHGKRSGRADMRQQRRGSNRWVAREGQLARWREDPDTGRVDRIPRLKDEHGLRKVELGCDRLHASVVEPLGVKHDSKRIAGERRLGEDVKREETARHRRNPPFPDCGLGRPPAFMGRSNPER